MKAIATVSRTNEILKKYGLYAKKGYGQNFIIEPTIVEKIARLSNVNDQSLAIEIGPGIGALTEQLALKSKEVVAYEIDDRLMEVLADTLSEYPNVKVIKKDFLKVDLKPIMEGFKKDYQEIRVCANLPYYITTPILFKLFEVKDYLTSITVMMQKEVADRFSATTNSESYNALTVIVSYLFDVKVVMKIPKTIFNPKPRIDSAVVEFIPKKIVDQVSDENKFFEFVKACFKQRRKTLYNNLKEYLDDNDKARELIAFNNFNEKVRAQELSLSQFVRLFESYER